MKKLLNIISSMIAAAVSIKNILNKFPFVQENWIMASKSKNKNITKTIEKIAAPIKRPISNWNFKKGINPNFCQISFLFNFVVFHFLMAIIPKITGIRFPSILIIISSMLLIICTVRHFPGTESFQGAFAGFGVINLMKIQHSNCINR